VEIDDEKAKETIAGAIREYADNVFCWSVEQNECPVCGHDHVAYSPGQKYVNKLANFIMEKLKNESV